MRNHGWIVRRAGVLALVMTALSASALSARAAETALKVGISERVNTALAFFMAQDAGFFREQGLAVEIINMNGGSRGAQELQAGHIDIMHVGLSSVVRIDRGGGDLRLVASLSNVIRFTLFAAPGVRTAADLRGGIIGISTFGSETDTTVTLALKRLGLARNEVTLKEYGGGPQRLAALRIRRDQGDRRQRTDPQPRARGGAFRHGRSRAGADPVALHRHRRQTGDADGAA